MMKSIKHMLRQVTIAGLAGLLLFAVILPPAHVFADSHIEQVANDNVIVYVDPSSGRYVIDTVEGHPQRETDDNKSLLFGGTHPKTSFTTFRINGEDFIYGNDYGFLGMDSSFVQPPVTAGLINQSIWEKDGIRITQTFTLVDDPNNENIGNVKITYDVENTTDSDNSIGSRILLDTKTGNNDAGLITLEGSPYFIEHETDVSGGDVPQYWRASEDNWWYDSGVVAYGMLDGWGNKAPDHMKIAHWEGIGATKWDYDIDDTLNFTTSSNMYGSADSAVALYWEPETLGAGEKRTYETYYGVGSILQDDGEALPYQVQVSAPQQLTVNEAKDDYEDGTFEIKLFIDNTLSPREMLAGTRAELTLPIELELVSGRESEIIGTIVSGKTEVMTWTVRARPQQSYKSARFAVKVSTTSSSAGSSEVLRTGFVLLPSVSGAPPLVQVHELLPEKKFRGDDEHLLTLAGTGFTLFQHDDSAVISMKGEHDDAAKSINVSEVTMMDDQLTLDVTTLWGEVPEAGVYEVKLETSEFGTFTKKVEFTDNPAYRSREYGLIAVTKVSGNTYKLVPVENEAELKRLSDEVLLTFRGNIRELVADEKFEISPGATINSMIQFNDSVDVANWFNRRQAMLIEQTSDGVSLQGMGTLSIPGFTFTQGEFAINLKNGKAYSLTPSQVCKNTGNFQKPAYLCQTKELGYDEPVHPDTIPIQIEWPVLTWLENNKIMAKLPVTLKSVTIGDGSVSFGGSVSLALGKKKPKKVDHWPPEDSKEWPPKPIFTEEVEGRDPFTLSVDMQEARFGMLENDQFGLQGVKAKGEVGMPEGLIPGIEFDANARVSIDTFKPEYIIEAGANFEVIEVEGKLGLRFDKSNVPIIDTFVFEVGSEPGIAITPATPIAYITKAGGGFEKLYDTVMGNYEVIPPLTVVLLGSLDVAKVVEANDMRLSMSLQQIQFNGDFSIVKFPILNNVYGQVAVADSKDYTGVDVQIGAELSIEELIEGYIKAAFSYDSRRSGLFGPVYLAGKGGLTFSLPKSFPIGGGIKFGGVEGELSNEQVLGRLILLGMKFGAAYLWSSGEVKLASLSGMDAGVYGDDLITSAGMNGQPDGIGSQKIYDESGKELGTMVFGTNVSRGADLVALRHEGRGEVMIASAYPYEYTLETSADHAHALFELKYGSEHAPNVKVTTPSGEAYPLIEEQRDENGTIIREGNILLQDIPAEVSDSGLIENWMYISALGTDEDGHPVAGKPAEQGTWTIASDQPLEGSTLNVAAMPEITELSSILDGNEVTVQWEAAAADGMDIAIYLSESDQLIPDNNEQTDFGTMMVGPEEVDVSAGTTTFTLPDTLSSGDYYIKAVLVDEHQNNMHSLVDTDPVTFVNAATPPAPTGPIVSPTGNGFITVDWDFIGEADGFALQALDAEGEAVAGLGAALVEDGEKRTANIGGTYTVTETGEEIGIFPGETYRVAISAYNRVNGRKIYSEPVMSDVLTVPVPVLPEVELSLDEPWDDELEHYVTRQTSVDLSFASDQLLHADVYLNDRFLFNRDDSSWTEAIDLPEDGSYTIEVVSTNETTGDMASDVLVVHRDTTAPDLKIESPDFATFSDAVIEVKGIAEPGSEVTVNGETVELEPDGMFSTELNMDGAFSKEVQIAAVDAAGNRTDYEAKVLNDSFTFDRIEMRISGAERNSDRGYTLIPGNVWDLEVVGIDKAGKALILDHEDVELSILQGESYGTVTADRQLDIQSDIAEADRTEGVVVVKAALAVSDDYTLEDAVVVNVDLDGELPPDPDGDADGDTDSDSEPDADSDSSSDTDADEDDRSGEAQEAGADGAADRGEAIDQQMEELLRSLIEADQNTQYMGGVMLSESGKTLIELDEQAVLTLYGTGAAFGYGKVQEPTSYIYGSLQLMSDMYEFTLSEPIDLDQPALFAMNMPANAGPGIEKAGIYWYNENKARWEFVGGQHDIEAGTISAELPHFSKYAMLLDPARTMFTDIAGRWSEDAVYRLQSIGIIHGDERGGKWMFRPQDSITRQEFIKLLVSAADLQPEDVDDISLPDKYKDAQQVGEWAMPYMAIALEQDWLSGVSRGDELWIEPQREISRAEAAVLMNRMIDKQQGVNAGKGITSSDVDHAGGSAADHVANNNRTQDYSASSFTDQSSIPQWATPSVAAMKRHKLINGYLDGSFRPGHAISREEAAQMINQLLIWQYDQSQL